MAHIHALFFWGEGYLYPIGEKVRAKETNFLKPRMEGRKDMPKGGLNK